MNTWDTDGKPESTRRRWKTGIAKCLERLEEAKPYFQLYPFAGDIPDRFL